MLIEITVKIDKIYHICLLIAQPRLDVIGKNNKAVIRVNYEE